jgi:imidazolonepropionase
MTVKLFHNARIWTASDRGTPLRGTEQGNVTVWERGALLIQDGNIACVGEEISVRKALEELLAAKDDSVPFQEIDCAGRCLVPGFVDSHTHMCFIEPREEEFALRLDGTPYLEILRRGGGILSSVRSVEAAGEELLYERTRATVLRALSFGTTTVEIKSGYGLDTETELKMLRVIDRIRRTTPLDVVPTFMGAHAVPPRFRNDSEKYVELLVEEMLPPCKHRAWLFSATCSVKKVSSRSIKAGEFSRQPETAASGSRFMPTRSTIWEEPVSLRSFEHSRRSISSRQA